MPEENQQNIEEELSPEEEVKELAVEAGVADERISHLEERITKLELVERYNKLQKSWEVSPIRITYILVSTYFFVVIFLYILDIEDPFLNAAIPAGTFVISQTSVSFLKRFWVKSYIEQEHKKEEQVKGSVQQPVLPEPAKSTTN